MTDNWYRITYPDGKKVVEYIYNNCSTNQGTVRRLQQENCLLEEVVVLTPRELQQERERAAHEARRTFTLPNGMVGFWNTDEN
jgi:hypothetical protein